MYPVSRAEERAAVLMRDVFQTAAFIELDELGRDPLGVFEVGEIALPIEALLMKKTREIE